MLGLASALMGASRANTAFDADDVSFSMTGSKSMGDGSIRFKSDGKPDVVVDVDMFETGGGYAYYDEKD
jgi:hypothetical protein